MINLWKLNTLVLLIQLTVGACTYAITGDHILTAVFAGAIHLCFFSPFGPGGGAGVLLSLSAVFASAAAVCGDIAIGGVFASTLSATDADTVRFFGAITTITAMTFAFSAADSTVDENPHWQRFICALPLGIGSIIGGVLILLNWTKKVKC